MRFVQDFNAFVFHSIQTTPTSYPSYMFHLTFTSTFLLILNASRVLLTLGGGGGDMERGAPGGCCSGFVGVVLAGCLTMPLAVLGQLLPLYNLPHDGYGIHTEVLLWILLGTYVLVVWIGGRNPSGTETRSGSVETGLSLHCVCGRGVCIKSCSSSYTSMQCDASICD